MRYIPTLCSQIILTGEILITLPRDWEQYYYHTPNQI
jgi:hypothetical protein